MQSELEEFCAARGILVGADPEVFVKDDQDRFISAHIFECGTKEQPLATKSGFVQVDGLALEFNIRPAKTNQEFLNAIKNTMADLEEIASQRNCRLVPIVTAVFGEDYISKLPEGTRDLGCNPDYDAYLMAENCKPNGSLPFRTGAGHIHIGWREPSDVDYDHFTACGIIARELDFYLGIPSLRWDRDNQRRQMYGRAGAFRPKPYGIEYRVLSNAWLTSDALISEVYERTQLACNRIRSGINLFGKYGGIAQRLVNLEEADCPKEILGEI